MTSSFRQRPQSTNYLATEADLSGAVNKEIDANIKDTQAFYDQMVELEKLRYENRDKNLALLGDFISSAASAAVEIAEANEIREDFAKNKNLWLKSRKLLQEETDFEKDIERNNTDEQKLAADATRDRDEAKTVTDYQEADDVRYTLQSGSFVYNENENSKTNVKRAAEVFPSIVGLSSKDPKFPGLDGKVMNDAATHEDADSYFDQYTIAFFQQIQRGRKQAGLRPLSLGQVRKYLSPTINNQRELLIKEWRDTRNAMLEKELNIKSLEKISNIFQSPETVADDLLGKEGYITNRKTILEAQGIEPRIASQLAFQETGEKLELLLQDADSGVDTEKLRDLKSTIFTFSDGSKGTLGSKNAPKGAKDLDDKLGGLIIQYDRTAEEKEENTKLEILDWKDKEHKEYMSEDRTFEEDQRYILEFKQRFGITKPEQLPDYIKDMQTDRELDDLAVITEITIRRSKNLPITESMVRKIKDPNTRDTQMQYVNTPELGAFTADEANAVDERIVAITKEAKDLKDLNQAKTDQYLVTRDNAKEFYTARFKELVVGGQSRATAFSTAKRETLDKMEKGDFDQETQLYIDTQATLDLNATVNALQKDASLIYSTEAWAGEDPHLDVAAEYIRSGGQTRYPSYYLRFTDIKKKGGAYLTPEEVFETRLKKTGRLKDGKIVEIPERKELKHDDGTPDVTEQNKLLHKNNATKTLDVASKGNNIEWMIKTMPGHSALNAEMFIRQLETNIQKQHGVLGISIPHKKKTTMSTEDSNTLLEAVPELREAPFSHPNTLSTAAINEMLNLNI